jgi:vancomycin resistance protein VanW
MDPDLWVPKPLKRSPFRKQLAREYFILKRKINWWQHQRRWASFTNKSPLASQILTHQSLLLRPLQGVDMQLQRNKITNLQLAIDCISGIVIAPGQTFSFWKLVGRPAKTRGFLPGVVLENGKPKAGTGGGLCQLGNLIYWMVLHSSLQVTERWRHSYDVFPDSSRVLPFGCGATLSYNYVDLQFYNPTPDRWQLILWLDDQFLYGKLLCSAEEKYRYEVFETDHRFCQQWWGGYTRHNRIWKKRIHKETKLEETELVTENHAITMYTPLLEESRSVS